MILHYTLINTYIVSDENPTTSSLKTLIFWITQTQKWFYITRDEIVAELR
jgi:hypothetical protein